MDEEVPCGGDHILAHLLCRVQLQIQALDAKYCGLASPMVLFSSFLTVPQCMWDLSSMTRDQTHAPCSEVQSTNHGSFYFKSRHHLDFPDGLAVRTPPADEGDMSSIPRLGRSPREGNSNPLQYFCLGKSPGQRCLVGYSPWSRKKSDAT